MIDYRRISALARDVNPETPSSSMFWTDAHISQQLLAAHLDPDTDAASRRPAAIEATISWLESTVLKADSRVLDLGCGPGLYASRLARKGHRVRGMDFSERSLAYARDSARAESPDIEYALYAGRRRRPLQSLPLSQRAPDIEYALGDYVRDDLGGPYDLGLLIYCDIGALSSGDRATLLCKVRASLAPGGAFAFDFADDDLSTKPADGKSWSVEESGFYSPRPHLVLEETKRYPELKMIQRAVIVAEDDTGRIERYMIRDWCFSEDDMRKLVLAAGFSACEFHRGFLPPPVWGEKNPIFCVARP